MMPLLRALSWLALWLLSCATAGAGQSHVTESELNRLLPAGLQAGVKDPLLPVWPILKDGQPVGYVFETNQLVDIPGFSGTPVDMLISLDDQGKFLEVRVVDQNEPVFVDGLGPQPLFEFVKQYRGKSIRDNIKVADAHAENEKRDGANTYIDGVTKATASVRIINETILASALKVARAKMAGLAPGPAVQLRQVPYRPMSWQQLLDSGLVRHVHVTNRDVEKAFAGTEFAGVDDEVRAHPDDTFIDLYAVSLDFPLAARNLFAAPGLALLANRLGDNTSMHAIAVMSSGPHSFAGPDFVRGSVPDRLRMRQGEFPVNIRDTDVDVELMPGIPHFDDVKLFKMDSRLGFDPAQPWTLSLRVTRQKGSLYPATDHRDFPLSYALPDRFLQYPPAPPPPWLASWRANAATLVGLVTFLALLSLGLAFQSRLTRHPRTLLWGRRLALAVTLGFVGYFAEGQLSIIHLLALVKSAKTGFDLSFLLYDPICTTLWIYVLGTLLIWGRGTFCGWLCPFGAFQEFVATVAAALRIPQLRLSPTLERRLPWLRYVVLAVLVGGTAIAPSMAETLAEAEPFKTAITLAFRRDWPFVLYALTALGLSLVVFKGYCRFLCPLGGSLALLSRFRILNWIPRRSECGSPCQLCAHRCRYNAIARDGHIVYHECFQCLDCVAIHNDPQTCVPLVLQARQAKKEKSNAQAG